MDYWKEKYEDLIYMYEKRGDKIDELKKENNSLYSKLESAEFKIRTELEPRIQQEHRSYDNYVTSGGHDECFSNGDSGRCGFECSIFGEREYCFDNLTDEQLIKAYEDGYAMDEIVEHFCDNEDALKRLNEIDKQCLLKQVEIYHQQVEIYRNSAYNLLATLNLKWWQRLYLTLRFGKR